MKKITIFLMAMFMAVNIFAATSNEKPANDEYKSTVIHVNSTKTFDSTIKDNKICLVDFYADWCPPCRMLTPVIEKMAEKYKGKITFLKVNVDNNQDLAGKYNVRGIPNVLIFEDGKVINNIVGYKGEDFFVKTLDKLLK